MTAILTATRKPVCHKPENRSIRLERKPTDDCVGRIVITRDGVETVYLLTNVDAAEGVAYQVDKLDAAGETVTERYHTLLNGSHNSCDCKWGRYGVNKKACCHVAGLSALHAQGKL